MSAAVHNIEKFSGARHASDGALSTAELDGYLTAVLVGPDPIVPSEWLSDWWAGEGSGSGSTEEVQTAIGAVMRHYDSVRVRLDGAREQYRPCGFPDDPRHPDSSQCAEEWSHGFWKAMQLRPYSWSPLLRDKKARYLLAPILGFITTDDGDCPLETDPEALDDILIDAASLIPEVIFAIRDYWRLKSSSGHPSRSERLGRNDPCAYGSGEKYQRCCGAK